MAPTFDQEEEEENTTTTTCVFRSPAIAEMIIFRYISALIFAKYWYWLTTVNHQRDG
jgi:hypothetical protein